MFNTSSLMTITPLLLSLAAPVSHASSHPVSFPASVGFADSGGLMPATQFNVSAGSSFSLDVVGADFAELAGGIMDLGFDPLFVQIDSVAVNASLFAFLPDGGAPGASGVWENIGFDVDVLAPDPLASGNFVIATVQLTALAEGMSTLSVLGSSEFFSSTEQLSPVLVDATLNVSNVPIPAAFWLLGSGIAGLFGFARRHSR